MKVLFIGNSHTYFNDMPALFRAVCGQHGIDVHVTMLTKGGMGLDYHLRRSRPSSTSATAAMIMSFFSIPRIPWAI